MDTLAKRLDTFLEKVVRERLLHKDEHVDKCTDFLDLLLHIHQGDEGNIDTVSIKSILLVSYLVLLHVPEVKIIRPAACMSV